MTLTVLLVEDDILLSRALSRVLKADGYQVILVNDVDSAKRIVNGTHVDLLVCDVKLPNQGSGVSVIRHVREKSQTTPMILMSAHPDFEAALSGIDLGVQRFLKKPFSPTEFRNIVQQVLESSRPPAAPEASQSLQDGGLGELSQSLKRATESLWLAQQPVVDRTGQRLGQELILRHQEEALAQPADLIRVALALSRLPQLSAQVHQKAAQITGSGPGLVFLRLHGHELSDEALYDHRNPLRSFCNRVVFGLTDDGTEPQLPEQARRLKAAGFQISIQLGSASGVAALCRLEPEYLRLDQSLVRDCQQKPIQIRVLRSLCSLGHELGMKLVAEEVLTGPERDALVAAGVDLLQGELFGAATRG